MKTFDELERILFLDVETVARFPDYDSMPEPWQQLWDKKAAQLGRGGTDTGPEELFDRSGLFAEFGKIICISVAFLQRKGTELHIRVKSFAGHDERKLLGEFSELLNQRFNGPDHFLCAHNGKEFDFPYLGRRMLANRMPLPELLQLSGKKPWEVRHLDTMQLWRFGNYKSYTSLELLAAVFEIPNPKEDLDGSKIYEAYYKDGDLARISAYCQKDVITLINLYLRINDVQEIPADRIQIVN